MRSELDKDQERLCICSGTRAEVDTACSSSLVSSNLLFNYLRKRPAQGLAEIHRL